MSEASNRIGDTPTGGLVRFAAPHGATRAEMRDWLVNSEFGKPLYETGDCLLVWANEGDLFACGLIHDTALAAAKAEGIRDGMLKAAAECQNWLDTFGEIEINFTQAREYACDAVSDLRDNFTAVGGAP